MDWSGNPQPRAVPTARDRQPLAPDAVCCARWRRRMGRMGRAGSRPAAHRRAIGPRTPPGSGIRRRESMPRWSHSRDTPAASPQRLPLPAGGRRPQRCCAGHLRRRRAPWRAYRTRATSGRASSCCIGRPSWTRSATRRQRSVGSWHAPTRLSRRQVAHLCSGSKRGTPRSRRRCARRRHGRPSRRPSRRRWGWR